MVLKKKYQALATPVRGQTERKEEKKWRGGGEKKSRGVKKIHRERPRSDLGSPTIVSCQLEPGLGGEREGPGSIPSDL